ncbi:alpha/beta fold hydrolase [Paenibacillus illinoisensis]|uniref:Alpha/beta fold hydrolase n=1 Tax=Paenibacillus illinoisensis TaxID=59845 RepID=A0ABW8I0W5_9BACL
MNLNSTYLKANDQMLTHKMDSRAASIIFMTGSTGFIGKEAVKQLIDENLQLLLLVRSESKARQGLTSYGILDFSRITFVQGDLSVEGLGLTAADRRRVLEADVIIHAGGTMDVTLGRKVAEQIFMNGAREVARLAEEIQQIRGLRHFIHVVGFMSPYGLRNEKGDDMPTGNVSPNESAYEEMKFHADLYLREHAVKNQYPLSVVNPSTVVGPRPTGETEQTGGIGLLIQAMQKRLMPVVPGGSSYWLPLVENDVVGRTLVFLTQEAVPTGGTYPLLARKETSPNMKELLHLLAKQLDVPKPKWAVPLSWMQFAMRSGGARISGVPAESVSFITDRIWHVEETEDLFKRMGQTWPDIREQLPSVTADMDYRLSLQPYENLSSGWTRTRIGNLAALGWEGEGEPWLIVHGMLNCADEMLPLGEELHQLTGNPVWLVDLAGFGRSAVHQGEQAFDGQVDELVTAIGEFEGPMKLVGHSIGATIASAALQRSGRTNIRLGLLQPVAHNTKPNMLRWIYRLPRGMMRTLLSRRSEKSWRHMLNSHSTQAEGSITASALAGRIRSSLQSPRIAGAHADLLRWIYSGKIKGSTSTFGRSTWNRADIDNSTLVVWAGGDTEYHYPEEMNPQCKRVDVPYGHYFPVFQYQETAAILVKWAEPKH